MYTIWHSKFVSILSAFVYFVTIYILLSHKIFPYHIQFGMSNITHTIHKFICELANLRQNYLQKIMQV